MPSTTGTKTNVPKKAELARSRLAAWSVSDSTDCRQVNVSALDAHLQRRRYCVVRRYTLGEMMAYPVIAVTSLYNN